MKKILFSLILIISIAGGASAFEISVPREDVEPAVRLVKKMSIGNIRGRLGHMAIDVDQNRLFVTAPDNNTVEVIDLNSGKPLNKMTLIESPESILYIPFYNWIVITSSRDGTCNFYDGNTYNRVRSINFTEEAGYLYYEASSRYVYVGYGYGGMAVIDTQNFNIIQRIGFNNHPEAFCVEENADQAYVNVPKSQEIEIVDLMMSRQVDTINLTDLKENYAMALDEKGRRLFVGCRSPAVVGVFDVDSKALVAKVDIGKDVDNMFYDRSRKLIYVSCGEGYLDVIRQDSLDSYSLIANIKTAPGAGTSLFVPEQGLIYVAVPASSGEPAQILVYQAG
jgi:DNA-binding beta-propeller fold protein YncE